uniref:Uncharacterized protein n=1 Tax=Nelumbo nucifera TaxID=4432 RepID=A0A822ZV83_NELNU|nr:TPA_asm: hypothetical protein HUJ06_018830 [Nelumbo nucifera]
MQVSDLRCLESVKAHEDAINAVAVSIDGTIYTAGADRRRVWGRTSGERRRRTSGERRRRTSRERWRRASERARERQRGEEEERRRRERERASNVILMYLLH